MCIHDMRYLTLVLMMALSTIANAYCRVPVPPAMPLVVPPVQGCPYNFVQNGRTCAPDYGARYSFVVPSGQSCPGNYSQMGSVCTAEEGACFAYYAGRNSCPSGYAQMGEVCASD